MSRESTSPLFADELRTIAPQMSETQIKAVSDFFPRLHLAVIKEDSNFLTLCLNNMFAKFNYDANQLKHHDATAAKLYLKLRYLYEILMLILLYPYQLPHDHEPLSLWDRALLDTRLYSETAEIILHYVKKLNEFSQFEKAILEKYEININYQTYIRKLQIINECGDFFQNLQESGDSLLFSILIHDPKTSDARKKLSQSLLRLFESDENHLLIQITPSFEQRNPDLDAYVHKNKRIKEVLVSHIKHLQNLKKGFDLEDGSYDIFLETKKEFEAFFVDFNALSEEFIRLAIQFYIRKENFENLSTLRDVFKSKLSHEYDEYRPEREIYAEQKQVQKIPLRKKINPQNKKPLTFHEAIEKVIDKYSEQYPGKHKGSVKDFEKLQAGKPLTFGVVAAFLLSPWRGNLYRKSLKFMLSKELFKRDVNQKSEIKNLIIDYVFKELGLINFSTYPALTQYIQKIMNKAFSYAEYSQLLYGFVGETGGLSSLKKAQNIIDGLLNLKIPIATENQIDFKDLKICILEKIDEATILKGLKFNFGKEKFSNDLYNQLGITHSKRGSFQWLCRKIHDNFNNYWSKHPELFYILSNPHPENNPTLILFKNLWLTKKIHDGNEWLDLKEAVTNTASEDVEVQYNETEQSNDMARASLASQSITSEFASEEKYSSPKVAINHPNSPQSSLFWESALTPRKCLFKNIDTTTPKSAKEFDPSTITPTAPAA